MNRPKFSLIFSFYFFLIICSKGFSQKDSSKKWLRFSIDAGIIVNRSFSHFFPPEHSGHFYSQDITKTPGTVPYLPGFSLGLTSLWGKAKFINFISGVSTSVTQARYHHSVSSYSEGVGYSGISQRSEVDVKSTFIYLNYEIGCRFKLFERFFLQQSFLVNQNLKVIQKENGIQTTIESSQYLSGSGTSPNYYRTDNAIHSTEYFRAEGELSARLSAFYQFKIEKRDYSIFVFRNFALNYKLPWWGLGLSVVL